MQFQTRYRILHRKTFSIFIGFHLGYEVISWLWLACWHRYMNIEDKNSHHEMPIGFIVFSNAAMKEKRFSWNNNNVHD